MRNTKQRKIVLDIINNSYSHPTAYQVHQECIKVMPNISLGTVYRNLNTLVSLGEIQRLDIPNQMTRYDKVLSHDHFICINCGNVYDLKRSDITYKDMIDGNKVLSCKINYEGVCGGCLNKSEGDDINGIKGK
ncbi:MAG: transcriptional repressor [Bacilli bacterium]|nr:transcriptional repressor [Bacilli bacterium]